MWGYLLEDIENTDYPIQPLEFTYPIEFDEQILKGVNSMIDKIRNIPIGQRINLSLIHI